MIFANVLLMTLWGSGVLMIGSLIFNRVLFGLSVEPPSMSQFSAFVSIFGGICAWLYLELYELIENKIAPIVETGKISSVLRLEDQRDGESGELIREHELSDATASSSKASKSKAVTHTFDPDPARDHPVYIWKYLPVSTESRRSHFRAIAEFSSVLLFVYISDRTRLLGRGEKTQSMDLFWFSFLCIVVPSLPTIHKHAKMAKAGTLGATGLLQRDQTEEWKGWMQVLFLLYHYFVANDIYNAIRLFIAAYVWMTGFGNFSYYYIKDNFSAVRFCQMMWRLNFLVLVMCVVLRNDYMCYYICPLHTLWTLCIYVGLGLGRSWNRTFFGICAKFVLLTGFVVVVFEIPGVWDVVFGPFRSLLRYRNPHHPEFDDMQEWRFRSGLDRYIWIFGMFCAFNFPNFEAFIVWLEKKPLALHAAIKALLFTATVVVYYFYHTNIYELPKSKYTQVHPFTSFIPITVYIVLRNFLPVFRQYNNALFGWLGKITLETYILQYHLWLNTAHPNYQPKQLLFLLPVQLPMVNFVLCSLIYIFVSHRMFHLTTSLRDMVIGEDEKHLWTGIAKSVVCAGGLYAAGVVLFMSLGLNGGLVVGDQAAVVNTNT
eukprot:c13130_g1_i2.p1 GENE.c13130_g1_i2~~c13130_g1_i2.p1  ORF type:complete len:601 (+),score=144.35 c13130_g1_i2:64-1866(+)